MHKKTLQEIQEELKKEIPFKWRVQSFSKFKPQATCVAYIDSRDVQDVLDANCLWSDRYYEENNMLFCEITIYADGREYKRSDTGSESIADAKKGHSSDAFKRAAVKFGVGRFLYSQPIKYIKANEVKNTGNYPFVVDNNGNKVYNISDHINKGLDKTRTIEPEKKQPINVDRLNERLNSCKDASSLEKTYLSFTENEKIATKVLTTKLKKELSKN